MNISQTGKELNREKMRIFSNSTLHREHFQNATIGTAVPEYKFEELRISYLFTLDDHTHDYGQIVTEFIPNNNFGKYIYDSPFNILYNKSNEKFSDQGQIHKMIIQEIFEMITAPFWAFKERTLGFSRIARSSPRYLSTNNNSGSWYDFDQSIHVTNKESGYVSEIRLPFAGVRWDCEKTKLSCVGQNRVLMYLATAGMAPKTLNGVYKASKEMESCFHLGKDYVCLVTHVSEMSRGKYVYFITEEKVHRLRTEMDLKDLCQIMSRIFTADLTYEPSIKYLEGHAETLSLDYPLENLFGLENQFNFGLMMEYFRGKETITKLQGEYA